MKSRIIAVTLFAMSLTTPATAEINYETIGGMRSACKTLVAEKRESSKDMLLNGLCLGWVIGEKEHRQAICFVKSDAELGKALGLQSRLEARNIVGHPVGALAQAFVNWADDHPELWGRQLSSMAFQSAFWSEFPCDTAN